MLTNKQTNKLTNTMTTVSLPHAVRGRGIIIIITLTKHGSLVSSGKGLFRGIDLPVVDLPLSSEDFLVLFVQLRSVNTMILYNTL